MLCCDFRADTFVCHSITDSGQDGATIARSCTPPLFKTKTTVSSHERFTALEYSFHDIRGHPSNIEEVTYELGTISNTNHHTTAAIDTQELSPLMRASGQC